MKNYDERIDTLITNGLQEIAGDYEAPDEIKVRIDQRIREMEDQMSMGVEDC